MKKHKSGIVFLVMFTACCLFAQGIWNMHDAEINGTFTFNQPQIFNKAVTLNGPVSYGTSSTLTLGTGILTGKNGNTIDVGVTDGTVTLGRDDAGTVTLTSKDNDANAALVVRAGGTGALTVGAVNGTSAILSSGWGIATTGAITGCTLTRAQLVQEDLAAYPVPVYELRAADGNVLGIADGQAGDHYLTYSAGVWSLLGNSPNSSTVTDISSFLFPVPAEYVAGQTITVRINALYTADGDTKTLDLNCYEITKLSGAKGADICATTIKTLTGSAVAYDFTITPTDVAPGDLLSLVVTTVFQDADGAVGEAQINSIDVLLDIKG